MSVPRPAYLTRPLVVADLHLAHEIGKLILRSCFASCRCSSATAMAATAGTSRIAGPGSALRLDSSLLHPRLDCGAVGHASGILIGASPIGVGSALGWGGALKTW